MKNEKQEIIFVDAGAGVFDLTNALFSELNSDVKIVFLDKNSNALQQIATNLQFQKNLDAIHIISHGENSTLSFANGTLNSENISNYAPLLEQIGQSLSENGDILLYGCNVAKDEKGKNFVNLLAKLTQADIAASDDLTGESTLGGDWNLEVHNGAIETDSLLLSSYQGVLAQNLINGLGGTSGFGENNYVHSDDPMQSPGIDITSVFGAAGVKFGANYYTTLFINNNGLVTFGAGTKTYTPNGLSAGVKNPGNAAQYLPTLALYWTDLDTRAASTTVSAGGNSTGANLVHWDLDTVNKKMTITWNDVAEYSPSANSTPVLAAQMILTDAGDGNMNIEYRYEYVAELKTHTATAGWNAGVQNGTANVDYFEIPLNTQVKNVTVSGTPTNVTALSDLDTRVGNSGQDGIFQFFLRNGGVVNKALSYDITTFVGTSGGNVANTATITLVGDTFATALIGTTLPASRVTNLPNDVSATLTIVNSTTATLSFSPTLVRAFSDADDRTNLTVSFIDSDFTGGLAAAITGATTTNLLLDFPNISPTFVDGTNLGLILLEDAAATTITNAVLDVFDPDNTDAQLIYTVKTLPTKGSLVKNGIALAVNSTFTQTDINNNLLTYTPTLNLHGSDNFQFDVADGSGGTLNNQVFNFAITAVNDVHTGQPTFSFTGTLESGKVLTASLGTLADVDEYLPSSVSMQWQVSADNATWFDIAGATNTTYTLGSPLTPTNELGQFIRLKLSWGNGDFAESEVSNSQAIIFTPPNLAGITSGTTVIEPVALPTTATNSGAAVNVFDFTIHDGVSDTKPTTISQIVLNTSGTADFSKVTWLLSGNDITGSVTGVYSSGTNTLTFSGLNISVADTQNETYVISAYYNNNSSLTEGQTYILSLAPNTGVTVGAGTTQLQLTQPAITNSTGTTVSVTATQLLYQTQPSGSVSGTALTTQPILQATDAFGNLDVDFIDTVSLTENSSGALSGTTSQIASAGVITFNDIAYTATADHETFAITANATGLTAAISNVITSDVIATKLEYAVQPEPTVIESGQTKAFTSVPSVKAVNAQNVLDVDYLVPISLAVTDPIDGILDGTVNNLISTGDTDLNSVTVTQTPVAGSATFAGLSLQYTSASASDNLAFRATSGTLTPINSQTLTANLIPSVTFINCANASTTNANTVNFTLTFSENVSGVDVNDFLLSTTGITDASITNIAGSGASYTVSVNTGSGDGSLRLDLNDDDSIFSATGIRLGGVGLGNGSFNSGQTYVIDKTPPTINIDTIASDDKINAQENNNSIVISGTTNGAEDGQIVTVNFGGMTKIATVSSNLWTTSLTPTEIQSFAEGVININAVVADVAGNSAISATKNVLYDKTLPTCIITSNNDVISKGETSIITFTFSEAVTGFTETDITAGNGSISTPITNNAGITWTAIYTPTIDIESATNLISLDNSSIEDSVGNKGSGVTQSPNYSVDTLYPTVVNIVRYIPSDAITNADTLTFRATFSEAVNNVSTDDFIITGTSAIISNINAINASTYDITLSGGDLADLNGTAQLDFSGSQNISDSFGNPLINVLPTDANETIYSLDNFAATPLLALVSDTGNSNVDAITSDGNIVVSNLESGATWEFSTDNATTWTSGTGSNFSVNSDANYAVLVRQMDVLGNVSSNAMLNFVLDTAALLPALALSTDSNLNNDKITNVGTVNVSNLESGASWEFSTDNGVTWQTGTDNEFGVSGDGNKTVLVRQTDVAGNMSATANLDFMLDTSITLPTLALSTDSNLNGDKITNVGTVSVSNLETGASWQVSTDNGVTWQTGTGNEFGISGDGNKTVLVRQTDVAGNISATANLNFMLDTAALLPNLALSTDSNLNGDKITNVGTVSVSNLETGASWQFSTDNGATWEVGTGDEFTVSGDGNKTVLVRQTDVAGNVSATANLNFELDTSIALPNLALLTDSNLNSDKITNVGTVSVSNLETGASWQFSSDSGVTWQTGTGNAFTVLGDGNKTVLVRQIDVAGNASISTSLNFLLDTTIVTPTLGLEFDSGISSIDSRTNNGTVVVSGLEANAKWEWSIDNTNWILGNSDRLTFTNDGNHQLFVRQTDIAGNVSNNASFNFILDTQVLPPSLTLTKPPIAGNATKSGSIIVSSIENQATWQYSFDAGKTWQAGLGNDLTLSGDGEKIVIARQIDSAGNISVNSQPLIFTLDTTVLIPSVSLFQDTGKSTTDKITRNGTINVSGIENGANWEFSSDNLTWFAGSGDFFTLTGDGEKAVFVRQIDPVGNISASNLLTFVLDTNALLPNLKLAHDSGKNGDLITRDGTVEISNLENGATWQFSTDDGKTWAVGNGNRFTLYGDGEKNVLVSQTDLAGNSAIAAFNFLLDTQISPLALTLARDTGKNGDFITSDGKVNVSGLEPFATWEYSLDGGKIWQTGQGNSLVLTGDGEKNVLVKQNDLAGNSTPVYGTLNFLLDSRADMPFLALEKDSGKNDDLLTNDGRVNVFGLEEGSTWRYSTDSGVTWLEGKGNQFELSGDGNKTVIVEQTDIAGNKNPNSMVLNFTLDTTIATPVAVLTNDSGKRKDDFITNDGTFDIANLENGATWRYSMDGGKIWLKIGDDHATLKNDGNKTVLIQQTDLAGNESEISLPLNFLLDSKVNKPILKLDTKNPMLHAATVSGIEEGASWEFSSDGITWTEGTGNQLIAANEVKSVLVRQTDIAGNVSENARIGFLPDVPTLTLINDSGRKNNDFITNDGKVGVSDLESGYFDWQYSTDNEKTWTKGTGEEFTLTGDDVKNVIATQIDSNGNRSLQDGRLNFVLDTIALPPSLTLIHDSGMPNDSLTNDGRITVENLEPQAIWQYSLDEGLTWKTGVEHRLSVSGDGEKNILVKQTDIAGNLSDNTSLTFTLDTQIDSPQIALKIDSGKDSTDKITNHGVIAVSNIENGAKWQYSTDSGNTWNKGENDHIDLTGDGNKTVLVRQTDLAGNTNLNSAALNFTLDTQIAVPTLQLANDTGRQSNDAITSDGTIHVLGLENGATWKFTENGTDWKIGNGDTFVISGEGSKNVSVRQTDIAGNSQTSQVLPFVLDATPPTLTSVQRPNFELPEDFTTFTVQIDYRDVGSGLDLQSISPEDISISGVENLTVASVKLENNRATYTINAPKDGWQATDVGNYQISINPKEVLDLAGNSLEPVQNVKTFTIVPKRIFKHPDTIKNLLETDSILQTTGKIADLPNITEQKLVKGQFGTFSIDKFGNWRYETDSPHNEFLDNKIYLDSFPIRTTDDVQSNVVIKIWGTNDIPILVDDFSRQRLQETQMGNVKKNVLHGQVAVQSAQGVPLAQKNNKAWFDLDETQLVFALKDSKLVGVDTAGHSLVKTTLKNGSTFTLNTWDGSYDYVPSVATDAKDMIDQFEISADSATLILNLNRLDLSDLDGISPDIEAQLANLSALETGEKPTGDLNGDNTEDKSQGGVVNIAWRTYDDFKAAQENKLTSAKPIINIVVAKEKASEIDDSAQLSHILVLPENSSLIDGKKPEQNENLYANWDPLMFSIGAKTDAGLIDMLPKRAGLQTKAIIDISRAGENFNAYLKYVSAKTIEFYNSVGNPLITLDGETLTSASQAGWYDFTQRKPDGDGGRFIYAEDGTVKQIEIILTDNAFGDDDPASGYFTDPGMPVFRGEIPQPPVTPEPEIPEPEPIEEKTLTSSVSVNALSDEFYHLIFQEVQLEREVTTTEWVDNPLLCLPEWTQLRLDIPTKIEQQVTVIEKFIAPLNGTGNALNNHLTGNNGANFLMGLAGKDILTGRAGADTFVYQNVNDSLPEAFDVITDFSEGDKIDLSALDANSNQAGKQSFQYLGMSDFSKQAAQLRFDGTTQQLQGDTNGDGKADFVIELSGISNLNSEALILKSQ